MEGKLDFSAQVKLNAVRNAGGCFEKEIREIASIAQTSTYSKLGAIGRTSGAEFGARICRQNLCERKKKPAKAGFLPKLKDSYFRLFT